MPAPILMDGDYLRSHLSISSLEDSGCWEWRGATTCHGYGKASRFNRQIAAHRFSYELLVGPIPRQMSLDHLCRNRRCVNPDHLEAVSVKENVLRGTGITAVNAKKTHCKWGHELTGDNLYVWYGERNCKVCYRRRDKERKDKRQKNA